MGESVEEEVEVDQAAIRPPPLGKGGDLVVAGGSRELEAPAQVVAGADVVAREDLETPEAPQEHVLGAPTADAGQRHQCRGGVLVVGLRQGIEAEGLRDDGSGEPDDRPRLRHAEPEAAQVGRLGCGEALDSREPGRGAPEANLGPVDGGQSVEEVDADGEGELLAGNGVHERLEDAGKARRP